MTPETFRDWTVAAQEGLTRLLLDYAELVELAYERPVLGSTGRGNADGAERDVGAVLASTTSLRLSLGDACVAIRSVHRSVNKGREAISKTAVKLDKIHPQGEEWLVTKGERIRERPATRKELAEVQRGKARELRREADQADKKAEQLERQVRAEERKQAAAKGKRKVAKPKVAPPTREQLRHDRAEAVMAHDALG